MEETKEIMMEKKAKILEGVDVTLDDKRVTVKGEKGELTREFRDARFNSLISIKKEDNVVVVQGMSDNRKVKAFVGTIAAHIRNMIIGVTKGFRVELAVVFTHFPMTFSVEENKFLIKNFVGEKGARAAKIIGNVEIKPEKTKITITGINKEEVGQTASNIEHVCKIVGKDRRTFQDGCFIVASGIDDETFVNKFDSSQFKGGDQRSEE